MHARDLIKAAISITAAGAVLEFGNTNYEALKSDYTLFAPIACLIIGGGLLFYGAKSFV